MAISYMNSYDGFRKLFFFSTVEIHIGLCIPGNLFYLPLGQNSCIKLKLKYMYKPRGPICIRAVC